MPWTVVCTHRSAYEGLDPDMPQKPYEVERREFRWWLCADFWRRFRFSYPTIGMRWVETEIVHASGREQLLRTRLYEWAAARPWALLYWLRSRWDGLRYGRDRDARS
jgi:hypothetical protein